jgi:hypothetical protein
MEKEPNHLPSPEEIRERCLEIQATWSAKEWRDHGEPVERHWLPPGVRRSLATPPHAE